MTRRAAAVALLLTAAGLVALLALCGSDGAGPGGDRVATPAPAAEAGGEVGAAEDPARVAERERRFDRVVKSMWWHQPRFAESDALGLRRDQVEAMDAICRRTLRRRLELRRALRAGQPRARASIEALDLEVAREQLEELEASSGELALIETTLTVDVLAVLDAPQLEVLRRDHPVILKRPWLKTLGGGEARRPARRPGAGSDGGASGSGRSRPAS